MITRYFIEKDTNQVKAFDLAKNARELSSKEIESLKNPPSQFHQFTYNDGWVLTEEKALEKKQFEKDERKFEVSERIKAVNEELMMLKMNPIPDNADLARIDELTVEQLALYQEQKELNRDPSDITEEVLADEGFDEIQEDNLEDEIDAEAEESQE